MRKDLTWEEAIKEVLAEDGGALHYAEIAERILDRGLRQPVPNPAATVRGVFSTSLRAGNSPFRKISPGEYMLRSRPTYEAPPLAAEEPSSPDEELETGAIQAFGMYWQREAVQWSRGRPRLLGRQSQNAQAVDFADQVGVYLLHDRDRVIYVGRAADALHTRLRAHTTDRLGGRWDRFSWFGLRAVETDGKLSTPSSAWSHIMVIETLEALLIESMEPPLNRKRGDRFAAAEYLQAVDPEIENGRRRQLVEELLRTASADA